ncbi:hypothetical protein D0T50_08985 [Bacteroides sp. 214]|uniref:DUF6377 domain-containing protein n=1 Tax=Bacteroides sp. 214 TaxID=2302935 RepID=UPI0013D067CF|nr:DUF6377 domain-containing protein [Bacteroides sp. 214]NDW13026.1 hypothetical protein [Bacteroides sp. 214]
MNKFLFFLFLICASASFAIASDKNIYKELDEALTQQHEFLHIKQNRIDSLKGMLVDDLSDADRFNFYIQLFDEYQPFILDSAFTYITKSIDLAIQMGDSAQLINAYIHQGYLYTFSGLYSEAIKILERMDPAKMEEARKIQYSYLSMTLYEHLARFALNEKIAANYNQLRSNWRDTILVYHQDGMLLADRLVEKGDYNSAIAIMEEQIPENDRASAIHYHLLSQIYNKQNNRQYEKKYLILSAIADIRNAVKEYISLHDLAYLLYEEGDIDRAYRYIHQCVDDAVFCNAKLRTIEISRFLPLIDAAYSAKEERHQKQIRNFLGFITLLSVLLFLSLIYVYTQVKKLRASRRRQHEINARLHEMNEEQQKLNNELQVLNESLKRSHNKQLALNLTLSDTNRIKEEYITRFLNLCSEYLTKMENYRRQLNQIAATRKVEDLYKELKSKNFIEGELDNFYKTFDSSFLHLYPHFVEKFNELLYPEEQIHLKPDERLTTELRVYALLRLGISDSGCMAEFLRHSASTIYNCRTKMRNKAIDRDSFENDVMKIM